MAKIVDNSIKQTYKRLINQTIEDLHKPIILHLPPTSVSCPNCIYDSINKKSSGVFDTSFVSPTVIFGNTITPTSFNRSRCPICYGEGILTSSNTKSVKALVRWNPGDDLENLPIGREGKPIVRIKTKRTEYDNVMNAEYFTVDGTRCEILRPPTIRGLGTTEVLVVAFLQSVEPGHNTNS